LCSLSIIVVSVPLGEEPSPLGEAFRRLAVRLRVNNYRKGSHTVYLLHYHFVFIPKYRKPILRGDVGHRLRELIRLICHATRSRSCRATSDLNTYIFC
jgi:hypothetical protein